MGTHPSGPASLAGSGELLQAWLQSRPGALGLPRPASSTSALPYLLKVLSVGKALSVQAHPDRELAARLHAARPDLYRDANHKPEMAVAVTPFEAMCSFRAPADLAARLRGAPELRALAGGAASDALLAAADRCGGGGDGAQAAFEGALRPWYRALMEAPAEAVAAACAALAARLAAAPAPPPPLPPPADALCAPLHPDTVAARLLSQYPNDVGVFSPYLLNTLRLAPGAALFLGANEPHAYLAGDCVEVMATSDNVVRAGLTPKLKDVATLTAMLTYAARGAPAVMGGAPVPGCSPAVAAFPVPVPDFELLRVRLEGGAGGAEEALPPPSSAAIILVYECTPEGAATAATASGETEALKAGDVWLQPADVAVALRAAPGTTLLAYRACGRLHI
jgi:mannose-6-phosphate isomerase